MCVDVLPTRGSVHHISAVPTESRGKGLGLLKLQSQMVVSSHVGTGTGIQVLWKSSWCT